MFSTNAFLAVHHEMVGTLPDNRPHVVCADGLSFYIQASRLHYCTPQKNEGPYTAIEIGYPSETVKEFIPYSTDSQSDPRHAVYAQVPVELVEAVVNKHGGFADTQD
jgi:hypothetical protein